MLATDANGLPLGMLTMSAGVGEVRMAEATLATINVPRCQVERTFAWLGHQRRLLVRHERNAENFHTFYTLACIRIALATLLR
jgi:hypothetical protein